MQRKYRVGVIGATGMVGQRFVTLLAEHPWFQVTAVAAGMKNRHPEQRSATENPSIPMKWFYRRFKLKLRRAGSRQKVI